MADDPTIEIEPTIARERICVDAEHPNLSWLTEVQLRAEWDRRGHTMAPTLRTAETRDIVAEANRRGYAVIPETGFENALTNPDLKLVPLERLLAEVGRRLDRRP